MIRQFTKNARINKGKACKKLRYRHKIVQSRHHTKNYKFNYDIY